MNLVIRKYSSDDYDQVLELLNLNTPEYFAASEKPDLIYYLNSHAINFYCMEIENSICGCGGFNATDTIEIVRLSWDIIHPQYQGKGLGRELNRFRIQEIRKIPGVRIISVRTSQLVYKFYEKSGFVLKEISKNYWAQGFDMYRMESEIGLLNV